MAVSEVKKAVRDFLPELCEGLSKTRVVSRRLAEIYQKTKDSTDVFLTDDLLKSLRIKLSLLDLEAEDRKENLATFFQPVPESELPIIDWDMPNFWKAGAADNDAVLRIHHNLDGAFNAVWWAYYDGRPGQPWVACKKSKALRRVTEYSFKRPYRWAAIDEAEVGETDQSVSHPHLISRVMNHTHAQDSLSRGEVMAIAAYMEWRSKHLIFFDNYYFPIQIVSMFHSGARILQAYHDGETLHISMSKLYDLSGDDNIKTYTLLARWLYSKPCGDTTATLEVEPVPLDGRYKRRLERMLYAIFERV
ncbi:hypothetical protein BDV06DRAFT_219072 [Aspergillus oleicola]